MVRLVLCCVLIACSLVTAQTSVPGSADSQNRTALPQVGEANAGLATLQSPTNLPPFEAMANDVEGRKEALIAELKDLEAMEKSLSSASVDYRATGAMENMTIVGASQLDAIHWLLLLAGNMQCEPDRLALKLVLHNQLPSYSSLLGADADGIAANLAYVKVPAIAQAGQRIKDDLRAAKAKLDEDYAVVLKWKPNT